MAYKYIIIIKNTIKYPFLKNNEPKKKLEVLEKEKVILEEEERVYKEAEEATVAELQVSKEKADNLQKENEKLKENLELQKRVKEGEKTELQVQGTKTHTEFDYSDVTANIYLVFGKESTGIPKEILKGNIDNCMRIPINDNIRALNLSNCVAIMVFEVLRQQNYPNLLRYDPFKGDNYLKE